MDVQLNTTCVTVSVVKGLLDSDVSTRDSMPNADSLYSSAWTVAVTPAIPVNLAVKTKLNIPGGIEVALSGAVAKLANRIFLSVK
jgi:hypothetical protein